MKEHVQHKKKVTPIDQLTKSGANVFDYFQDVRTEGVGDADLTVKDMIKVYENVVISGQEVP